MCVTRPLTLPDATPCSFGSYRVSGVGALALIPRMPAINFIPYVGSSDLYCRACGAAIITARPSLGVASLQFHPTFIGMKL